MQSNDSQKTTKTDASDEGRVDRRSYLKLVGGAAFAGATGMGMPVARGADGLHRTLTIEGTGSSTNYEFTAEGDVAKSTAMGATLNGNDTVSGSTASGGVINGRDSYSFSGEIIQWAGDYDALNLYLNGEKLENLITIKGPPSQQITYRLRVDGEVLKSTDFGGSINNSDEISGRTKDYGLDTSIRTGEDLRGETVVEGSVNNGKDSFLYSGDVSDLTTDSPLEVYINGELVQYQEFERDIITIDGDGLNTSRAYSFTVETDVAKCTDYGGTINGSDTIDGNDISGSVTGGRDSWAYTGEIQAIDVPSSVKVLKNGTEINPGSLLPEDTFDPATLPNKMTISIDTEERQDYGFSVTNNLALGPLGNPSSGDRAANGYGRGYGANTGADEYLFSGELESVSDFTCVQLDVDRPNQQLIVRDLTGSANPPYGYEITVSGSLSKADSNNNATINGNTVSGVVAGETDVFDFTGELLEVIFPTSIKVKHELVKRPLVDREVGELRDEVDSSGQYSVIEDAFNECNITADLNSCDGTACRDPDNNLEKRVLEALGSATGETRYEKAVMYAERTEDNLVIKSIAERDDGLIVTCISDAESDTKEEAASLGYVPYDMVVS